MPRVTLIRLNPGLLLQRQICNLKHISNICKILPEDQDPVEVLSLFPIRELTSEGIIDMQLGTPILVHANIGLQVFFPFVFGYAERNRYF